MIRMRKFIKKIIRSQKREKRKSKTEKDVDRINNKKGRS